MGTIYSSTAQLLSESEFETCASHIPLEIILSSIDEIKQIKENEL